MADFKVRAGVTDPLVFTLQTVDSEGTASNENLTGYTLVALRLRYQDGVVKTYNTDGDQLAVTDEDEGQVTFSPASSDLSEGDYDGYFLVTDANGKIAGYPSNKHFTLEVCKDF